MAVVRIKVDKNGESATIMDVCGGGSNCEERTAALEAALGSADESSRKYTDSHTPELPDEATLEQD